MWHVNKKKVAFASFHYSYYEMLRTNPAVKQLLVEDSHDDEWKNDRILQVSTELLREIETLESCLHEVYDFLHLPLYTFSHSLHKMHIHNELI